MFVSRANVKKTESVPLLCSKAHDNILESKEGSAFRCILVFSNYFSFLDHVMAVPQYVAKTKLPTLSTSLLLQWEETMPGSQFLGSINFTRCHEGNMWSKLRRAVVKRRHDVENTTNGIILWAGWRACWEWTWRLSWGYLSFAGRLLVLEQIVGPNKPNSMKPVFS